MLVRILAVGLNHALWKNVFHHLRTVVPDRPFAAGYFSKIEELAYLQQPEVQRQWRREPADVVLTDPAEPGAWPERLALLRALKPAGGDVRPRLGLVFHTLSHGLRHLVQSAQPGIPLQLTLDNGVDFLLSDPSLLVSGFPEKYPRLRLDTHLDGLQLPAGKNHRMVRVDDLSPGTLLALRQIQGVVRSGESLDPVLWIEEAARSARMRLPADQPRALYRERGGLYLFPGVPVRRVRQVRLGGLRFQYVLDLGRLSAEMPGFAELAKAVRAISEGHQERIELLTERIREREARTDFPIWCAGEAPVVAHTWQVALAARGYRQVFATHEKQAPHFETPVLLLHLGAEMPKAAAQTHPPMVLELGDAVDRALSQLDELLPWRELKPEVPPAPITAEVFETGYAALIARTRRAREGQAITERRLLLLDQELAVLADALNALESLLMAPVEVWNGHPPGRASQVLLCSFDGEEAQAALQRLAAIPKRRWLDLGPITDADSLRGVDLGLVDRYAPGGAVYITPTAQERISNLRSQLAAQNAQQQQARQAAEAARAQYQEALAQELAAAEGLVRGWIAHIAEKWLDANESRLLEALRALRPLHEQDWFTRGAVNRILLIGANGANRQALVEACERVFPQWSAKCSQVVPYDFDPNGSPASHEVPEREDGSAEDLATDLPASSPAVAAGSSALMNPPAAAGPQAVPVAAEGPLGQYLEIIASTLAEGPPVDLMLIEQEPEIAVTILQYLRSLEAWGAVPAVLVLSDSWEPLGQALDWPRTRIVPMRRMGALDPHETANALQAVFAI